MIRMLRARWLLLPVVLFIASGCQDDANNQWGSKNGNENVREAVRDEMIRNGSDPNMADAHTKLKYDEERSGNQSK